MWINGGVIGSRTCPSRTQHHTVVEQWFALPSFLSHSQVEPRLQGLLHSAFLNGHLHQVWRLGICDDGLPKFLKGLWLGGWLVWQVSPPTSSAFLFLLTWKCYLWSHPLFHPLSTLLSHLIPALSVVSAK